MNDEWTIEGRDVFIERWSGNALETITREEAELRLNEYETLKEITERLKVIFDSIDDYLAPVTAKGTTKDEYVPVEASTLAWWMDAIEEILEDKDG